MGTEKQTIDTDKKKDTSHDQKPSSSDDGPLDSIGKAITDPLTAGAEDEEIHDDGRKPIAPGG